MTHSQGPQGSNAPGDGETEPRNVQAKSVKDAGGFHAYWRSNLRIMAALLVVWFVVPFFLGIVFVEPLNQIHLAGFPLGFWFAQQGSIYVFFVLVLVYALWMRRLDREHGAE